MKYKNQKQDYILQEEDTGYDAKRNKFDKTDFARHKLIRLILINGEENSLKQMLGYFNECLLETLKDQKIQRWVQCIKCKDKSLTGHFFVSEKFQPYNELDKCSNKTHKWDSLPWFTAMADNEEMKKLSIRRKWLQNLTILASLR